MAANQLAEEAPLLGLFKSEKKRAPFLTYQMIGELALPVAPGKSC
jgi:hypothetical protein